MRNSIIFPSNLFSYNFYNQLHHIWDEQRGWSMSTNTTSLPLFCSSIFAASADHCLAQAGEELQRSVEPPAMHSWEKPSSVILRTPQVPARCWGLLSGSAEAISAPG